MDTQFELKLYLFGQAGSHPEWVSLLGDKYRAALPFRWSYCQRPEEAQVIVWDALLSTKAERYGNALLELLREGGRILLLYREAYTLYQQSPQLREADASSLKVVELAHGNLLPEDLLEALEKCRELLKDV